MAVQRAVTTFRFEDRHPVRVLSPAEDGPCFEAKGACDALGLADPAMAVASLDDDEKGINLADAPGGEQDMLVVVEHQEARIERAIDTAEHAFKRSEPNHEHFSVTGYCIRTGRELGLQAAARHGKELTRLCKGLGVPVAKVADPRFGKVNAYPESTLKEHFGDAPKGACS